MTLTFDLEVPKFYHMLPLMSTYLDNLSKTVAANKQTNAELGSGSRFGPAPLHLQNFGVRRDKISAPETQRQMKRCRANEKVERETDRMRK